MYTRVTPTLSKKLQAGSERLVSLFTFLYTHAVGSPPISYILCLWKPAEIVLTIFGHFTSNWLSGFKFSNPSTPIPALFTFGILAGVGNG